LPLAATLTTERVYEGFLGEFEQFRAFFHGHTYTGNPLACAAALATLDVFEEERTLERVRHLDALLGEFLEPIAALPQVAEVRRRGLMVGVELRGFPVEARMGHRVTLAARARGAVVRPLGDVVILMPPLAIAEGKLRALVEIVAEAIAAASAEWIDEGVRRPPPEVAVAA
jgi:adenosylmethionine---8-amino-7-oxononanoate aminotransferase